MVNNLRKQVAHKYQTSDKNIAAGNGHGSHSPNRTQSDVSPSRNQFKDN
jgi:hypothetical protein